MLIELSCFPVLPSGYIVCTIWNCRSPRPVRCFRQHDTTAQNTLCVDYTVNYHSPQLDSTV